MADDILRIHYHRDFDGMVSAAVLAVVLREVRGEAQVAWSSVNYDQRSNWEEFSQDERFAIVDFHFHPEPSTGSTTTPPPSSPRSSGPSTPPATAGSGTRPRRAARR